MIKRFKLKLLIPALMTVTVIGFGVELPLPDRIARAVEGFIRNRCDADSLIIAVNVPGTITPPPEGSGALTLCIDWKRPDEQLSGRVMMPVRIVSGKKTLQTVYTTATIRKFDRVYRAKRLVQRHEQIGDDDLEFALSEVTRLVSFPYKRKAALVGKRVTRVVSSGRIITEDMVENLPLVGRGDRIQILVRHGNLIVSTIGFAQEDGWLGDQIRVRYAEGRREIIGRVKEKSIVEVGT